jgi:hypothetical protein
MNRRKKPTAAAVRRATEAGMVSELAYLGALSKLGQQAEREKTKRAKAKR